MPRTILLLLSAVSVAIAQAPPMQPMPLAGKLVVSIAPTHFYADSTRAIVTIPPELSVSFDFALAQQLCILGSPDDCPGAVQAAFYTIPTGAPLPPPTNWTTGGAGTALPAGGVWSAGYGEVIPAYGYAPGGTDLIIDIYQDGTCSTALTFGVTVHAAWSQPATWPTGWLALGFDHIEPTNQIAVQMPPDWGLVITSVEALAEPQIRWSGHVLCQQPAVFPGGFVVPPGGWADAIAFGGSNSGPIRIRGYFFHVSEMVL